MKRKSGSESLVDVLVRLFAGRADQAAIAVVGASVIALLLRLATNTPDVIGNDDRPGRKLPGHCLRHLAQKKEKVAAARLIHDDPLKSGRRSGPGKGVGARGAQRRSMIRQGVRVKIIHIVIGFAAGVLVSVVGVLAHVAQPIVCAVSAAVTAGIILTLRRR